MATWDFDAPTQDPRVRNVQSYVTQTLQSTKAGLNASRMLSLYEFLKTHPFSSPEDLRKAVTQGGEPLFTPEEAAQVHEALKQKGGGAPPPEFFDKIIRKLLTINPFELIGKVKALLPLPGASGTGGFPFPLPSLSFLKSLIFMLYAYERDPNYGPLLSIALDTTTKLLPTIAMTAQTMAAPLAGLVPIPGGGAAGALVGWAIGAIFAFTAILMNLSRRKFGTAFVTSMGLIPVAGPAIMEAAEDLESTMARVSQRREKLVQSTRALFGDMVASQVEGIIPDLTSEDEEEVIDPPFPIPVIPNPLQLLSAIPNPLNMLPAIPKLTDVVNPAALTASPAEIEKLSDQATGEVPKPPETPAAPPKLPTSLADLKSSAPSLANLAPKLPAIPQVPTNLSGLANVAKSSLPPLPKPPASLPVNPIEAFKKKTGQIAKGRNGLTGGGPRIPQWETITIQSGRRYGSGLSLMTVPVSYRTS